MAFGMNKTSTDKCGIRAFQAKACHEERYVEVERWKHSGSKGNTGA